MVGKSQTAGLKLPHPQGRGFFIGSIESIEGCQDAAEAQNWFAQFPTLNRHSKRQLTAGSQA
jgi:hypothetical protein